MERRQTGTVKYKQDVFLLFHMVHIHEVIIFEPQSPGHPTPALWPQYDPSPSPPSLDEVNQRLFFWCCYQNVCPMVDIMRRSGCWCIAQSGMSFRHYCARSVSFWLIWEELPWLLWLLIYFPWLAWVHIYFGLDLIPLVDVNKKVNEYKIKHLVFHDHKRRNRSFIKEVVKLSKKC